MNQQNTHILTLIKLLEGHLSVAQGMLVREQLASDSVLLQHWKTLSSLYKKPMSPTEFSETDFDLVDSELVAAFVEERMSFEEQHSFESFCWNDTAVLREVISAYQSAHLDSAYPDIPSDFTQHATQASRHMLDMALDECNHNDFLQPDENYLQEIKTLPQSDQNTALTNSVDLEVYGEPLNVPQRNLHLKHRITIDGVKLKPSQRWLYVVVAIVVVVIALPAYLLFFDHDESTSITKDPTPENSVPVRDHRSLSTDQNPNLVPVPEPTPQLTIGPETKRSLDSPQNSPDSIVKTPPMDKEDIEEPIMARKYLPDETIAKVDLQVAWTRLAGISGYRTDATLPWKGILSGVSKKRQNTQKGVLNVVAANKKFMVRTLPFSWLQGKVEPRSNESVTNHSSREIVADANSEIQLAIQGVPEPNTTNQSDNESDPMRAMIDLELHSGKVAFTQLQAGDTLRYREGQLEWTVQANQEGTSFGLIQSDEHGKDLIIFSGEVHVISVSEQQEILLKADQMVVLSGQGFSTPSKATQKQRWLKGPVKSLRLSKAFIERMNQSDDLMTALLSASPIGSGSNILISTNLGFSLDPIDSVPRAAFSQSEVQRVAAINWLIAAQDNQATRTVWNKIGMTGNVTQSTLSVRTWFRVAQGKVPRDQKFLRELSTGLEATQPLFVRQCSIYFLRQITRQRLAEYDPNRPTKAAINSVRQKARRATGNNNRRRP